MDRTEHKNYSKSKIAEAIGPNKTDEDIKKLFCDERVDDDDLLKGEYAGEILRKFIGLSNPQGDLTLKGRCFISVNVKTSSSEQLNPISFRTTQDSVAYTVDYTSIDDGGRITDIRNPEQELEFKWNPARWKYEDDTGFDIWGGYTGAVRDTANEKVIRLFKSPYGPHYVHGLGNYNPTTKIGNKYNVLGDIYYNALGMQEGECWVWIYHFDYDIYNDCKFLSYVLAVGDNQEDYDTLMGKGSGQQGDGFKIPRNQLRNYIMLVKARYVRKLERQRQVESVKSSVAAIMSRNMSHNLGSHYLYYTKNQLAKLAEGQEQFAPDIRGAAKVLGYMQARMDYLATIVSGDKYPYGSVFFKGQIFDDLTIDDFSKRHFEKGIGDDGRERQYKRTTNYLLQNLILSENFTRGPVVEGEGQKNMLEGGNKLIRLQISTQLGEKIKVFTGGSDKQSDEEDTKLAISKLCIALPGGIMSIHAFFNVVENLIRNSAKYCKEDCKEKELVFTIAIKELSAHSDLKLPARYQFVIYDNKVNAFNPYSLNDSTPLIGKMNQQLMELKIYDNEKNELDKNSKGLKEMLFSTLWMRAYTYEKTDGKTEFLSDILAQMDRLTADFENEEKAQDARRTKWNELKQHAFDYVAVDKQGVAYQYKVNKEGNVEYVDIDNEDHKAPNDCNLGIRFELPKYRMMENIEADKLSESLLIEKGLNNFTDILCVGQTALEKEIAEMEAVIARKKEEQKAGLFTQIISMFSGSEKDKIREESILKDLKARKENSIADLKTKFTRVYPGLVNDEDNEEEAVEALRTVLKERFPNFDEYRISITGQNEKGFDACDQKKFGIFFQTHLADLEEMKKYAYSEAVSGENFTKTIENLFVNGIVNNVYKTKADEYFGLKIKEAALTRITLVDERLYNDMISHPNKSEFLKYKNIRVLNLKKLPQEDRRKLLGIGKNKPVLTDLFDGNHFRDDKDETHFLSIHLGMVEKIVKDGSPWIKVLGLDEVRSQDAQPKQPPLDNRVDNLMRKLRETFKTKNGELFISIHSGRGNFSPDLDRSLKRYPFISISALESVYSNSKFLLAQLFYNTVYIGKGIANQ